MFKSKLINLLNNFCEPSNKSYYFVEITIFFVENMENLCKKQEFLRKILK